MAGAEGDDSSPWDAPPDSPASGWGAYRPPWPFLGLVASLTLGAIVAGVMLGGSLSWFAGNADARRRADNADVDSTDTGATTPPDIRYLGASDLIGKTMKTARTAVSAVLPDRDESNEEEPAAGNTTVKQARSKATRRKSTPTKRLTKSSHVTRRHPTHKAGHAATNRTKATKHKVTVTTTEAPED